MKLLTYLSEIKSLSLKSIPLLARLLKSFKSSLGSTTTPFPIIILVLLLCYSPTGRKLSSSPLGSLSIRNSKMLEH
jgi:hypothetical protein